MTIEQNQDSKGEVTPSLENKEEISVPDKFKSLVGELEKMTVLDLAELVKVLEKKFGVSAAAPVAMVAGTAATPSEETKTVEEKSSFNVELTQAGDNKIGVIKVVRAITNLGLKDVKDLVDGAPCLVKEGVKKEEAEVIKKQLEEAGAKVTLK